MLFDEFDRGVVILGDTNDSHFGVGPQRPVNAVPHQQAILGNDDRNAITHLDTVLPRSFMVTPSLSLLEAVSVDH